MEASDEELLEQYRMAPASSRGVASLNQLFERHHSRVAAWCYRMTGDVDTATDLAQEVFLKVFQRIDSFRKDAKFTTWLYSIARNHCLDELRSRGGRPVETSEVPLETIIDSRSEDVSQTIERNQSELILKQLMRESLDATESQVMTMHYVHELPLDSITRLLGLSNQSGAKAYIVSAKRKLNRGIARWKSGSHQARRDEYAE
jgi:RNA polymerase sigma-70 factor, ECF subfamily